MTYSPDMAMGATEGYPEPGPIMDHVDHPDHMLPEPGLQPRMKHSTQMAGEVIPLPMTHADKLMALSGQIGNSLSLKNIAKEGVKSVDTTNLTTMQRKQ
jgi:hypothetical protein